MAIPKISELYDSILSYLNEYGETALEKIRNEMAQAFYIPEDEAYDRREMR